MRALSSLVIQTFVIKVQFISKDIKLRDAIMFSYGGNFKIKK